MTSLAESNLVIARKKRVIVSMAWAKKLNHSDPVWYEYRSALAFEDAPMEVPEDLKIICQWKRKDGAKPENWTFGLFFGNDRIYAIDAQPLALHLNKVVSGRRFFQQRVKGIHEHTWSEEGYGYAEPLTLHALDGSSLWAEFLARAGIAPVPFVHPDKAINQGQQELDL